jgi:hypothetical protein
MSYARRGTIIAAIATLAVMVDDNADAQTLTNPNPPASSRPPLAAELAGEVVQRV